MYTLYKDRGRCDKMADFFTLFSAQPPNLPTVTRAILKLSEKGFSMILRDYRKSRKVNQDNLVLHFVFVRYITTLVKYGPTSITMKKHCVTTDRQSGNAIFSIY